MASEATYKSKGGNGKIFTQKFDYSNIKSKIASRENESHKPGGGDRKMWNQKLQHKSSSDVPKRQSTPKPEINSGKEVIMYNTKLDFTNVRSKIGSLDNIKHQPQGGHNKIFNQKLEYNGVKSRIGSLDNINHMPGGGNLKIFDDPLNLKNVKPRIDNKNDHIPGGGDLRIFDEPLDLKHVKPKVDNKNDHAPGGGRIKIFDEKPRFEHVKPRVGSLENAKHQPGGGKIKVITQPLVFGTSTPKSQRSKKNGGSSRGKHGIENMKELEAFADYLLEGATLAD